MLRPFRLGVRVIRAPVPETSKLARLPCRWMLRGVFSTRASSCPAAASAGLGAIPQGGSEWLLSFASTPRRRIFHEEIFPHRQSAFAWVIYCLSLPLHNDGTISGSRTFWMMRFALLQTFMKLSGPFVAIGRPPDPQSSFGFNKSGVANWVKSTWPRISLSMSLTRISISRNLA
jgi:hypothetical protein